MTETAKKPAIRFDGFSEAWEQRKLGDCFDERSESMPDGELISVTINDGIKRFSELGRHDNSNEDKSKYKRVCIGDIAYNSMSKGAGMSERIKRNSSTAFCNANCSLIFSLLIIFSASSSCSDHPLVPTIILFS